MSQPRVLVADDEPIVRDVLSRYLERAGFTVDTAENGEEALVRFGRTRPDLVVLDLMMPVIDGIEVFSRIRRQTSTPVIMLTARGQEAERIAGLELGADDYVAKPFSPREVTSRVRAVLRRAGAGTVSRRPVLRHGELEMDPAARTARRNGVELSLTPRELDLLLFLAEHPGQVFTRVELLEALWDFAFDGDPSTVTVHIRRLREKIEDDPSRPKHLITAWGVGYRFDL